MKEIYKVAFFELEGWEIEHILNYFKDTNVVLEKLSKFPIQETPLEEIEDVDIISTFIYSKVDKDVISRLPNLKLIATRSTGYDHIDLDFAKERGVAVCNVKNYGDITVAEYTVGLILSLLRKFKITFERVSKGVFSKEGLRGLDLHGKKVGVIGTGNIGSRVVKILSAFEVDIYAYDINPSKRLEDLYDVKYVPLEELLRLSDIITIHVPYTPSTHHLINTENIKLLKRGSFLINTSRGKVVDTEAVIFALKEGILQGVALDTFEGEEVWVEEELILGRSHIPAYTLKSALESFYILHWDNAILTPHNAYNTEEALFRILRTTLENIRSFVENGSCVNAVT